jgi:hypothetical protein
MLYSYQRTGGADYVMTIDKEGSVGIGTTSPGTKLDIQQNSAGAFAEVLKLVNSDNTSQASSVGLVFQNSYTGAALAKIRGYVGVIGNNGGGLDFTLRDGNDGTYDSVMTLVHNNANSGNVGIGTTSPTTKLHVVGDVTVTGNIAAKYQDLAEWVQAPAELVAGTVVVLNPMQSNQVRPSSEAYDTRVAGVVSNMPGILLGEAGEGKVKVATTGRVKVKVDAARAPIQVGDLLVTSNKEGIAMRSEPVDIGGVPIHRPGTIIGKALEPLKEGEGEILVLLSLQ